VEIFKQISSHLLLPEMRLENDGHSSFFEDR
jgi:hypothetical protein